MPVRVRGTGMYVPADVRDNQSFCNYLDTTDEWIVTRTGIRERHYAAPEQAASDLALEASRAALKDAGISADDIDLIVCCTATGDHPFPATAAFIQAGLGSAKPTAAMDVSAACAGFLYGSSLVSGLLSSGVYENVLVVGAEVLTRVADAEDRTTCVLFGDGAGAVVYSRSNDPEQGILYSELGCEGSRTDHIWIPAGGSRLATSSNTVAERLHYLRMKGREVYRFAVNKMQELIDRALESCNLTPEDIRLIIPHQSNMRIIESVREKLGLPAERVSMNIDRYGNTSAASVPIALHEARKAGRVKAGDLILMVAIGAGLSWGLMILRL